MIGFRKINNNFDLMKIIKVLKRSVFLGERIIAFIKEY